MRIFFVALKSIRNVVIAGTAVLIVITPASAGLAVQGPSGGTGGSAFYDWCTANESVHELRILSGAWVDSIQLVCVDSNNVHRILPQRGRKGASQKTILFAATEKVVSVTGYYNKYIRYLRIRSSFGKTYSFGIPNGRYFSYYRPKARQFSGLRGASGKYLDSIGSIWR